MDSLNRLSLNLTVARQTPKNEFGQVMKNALNQVSNVSGALMGMLPGSPVLSAAVSSVAALAKGVESSAAGITSIGAGSIPTGTALPGGVSGEMGGMIGQMRAEADRSLQLQMQMQDESREYNALSNIIKVRHESAKAAISNLR